jgi:hypothetical protein
VIEELELAPRKSCHSIRRGERGAVYDFLSGQVDMVVDAALEETSHWRKFSIVGDDVMEIRVAFSSNVPEFVCDVGIKRTVIAFGVDNT